MRTIRVYTNQVLVIGEEVTLDDTASRHLATVLRLKAGDEVTLFNGQGGEYLAVLVTCKPKGATALISQFSDTNRESPLNIHLGIGLSRGDRMDWAIQKATEAGVTEITPLYTERTEVKLKGDRAEKKLRHWQQVCISACEQSFRTHVPTIYSPTSIEHWCSSVQAEEKLVLHHRSTQTIKALKNANPASVGLLIGPEGGLTEQEIGCAEAVQFTPLTLGPRVLRTETAPVIAIGILQSLWGDF